MSSFQIQNSEVLARLKPFGISFEKSLNDLIKGIRAHSKDSPESLAKFLDAAIQECKTELYSTDLETKAMAVLKLAYLEMYGFDMSWCNFQILEVMSSNKFQQKRIGYLAAIQSFKNEQDLLILATNQFKKDLNSSQHVEVGLALSGIASIVTPSLSQDINDDVLMKLNHSKPYIRKKAILAMYKIFLQYPDSLRMNFHRVIEKLDDTDVSVVSATVNVICELSKKNPKLFLNYLPKLFSILEETKNNWLIIRILKLFQSLSRVEPRMKKKILPAIMDLMHRTQASSLIYECINCAVNGQMLSAESSKDKQTAKLCIQQLMNFFKTKDSNLKFVGLIALINILKIFPVFMHSVEGVSEVIMDCLNDPDLIIKKKALEVSSYLVNDENIVEVVKVMLLQLIPNSTSVDDSLKLEVTSNILRIASKDSYSNIPNFRWYVAVLKDILNLTLLPIASGSSGTVSTTTSKEIATQIGNEIRVLATKVPSIRPVLLEKIVVEVVLDENVMKLCPLILKDVYWVLGEYIDEFQIGVDDDDEVGVENEDLVVNLDKKLFIFNTLVNYRIDEKLGLGTSGNFKISSMLLTLQEPQVLSVLIQALVKLYNGIVYDYTRVYSNNGEFSESKYSELCYHLYRLIGFLSNWERHYNYEVQERALSWLEFLRLCQEAMNGEDLSKVKKLEMKDLEVYGNKTKVGSIKERDSSDTEKEDESSSDDSSSSDEYENLIFSDNEKPSKPNSVPDIEPNPFAEQYQELNNNPKSLPGLLSNVLPSFFKAYMLKPVAKNAQLNIGLPENLDLDSEINEIPQAGGEFTNNDTYDLFLSDSELFEEDLIQLSSAETESERRINREERMLRLKDSPYYLEPERKSKTKSKRPEKGDEVHSESSPAASLSSKKEEPTRFKKKKSSKIKKEKVLILDEESVEGAADLPQEQITEPSKKSKGKKNALKIDSSKLDDFDLLAAEPVNASNEEYDIDLEVLRAKLSQTSIDKPKKKKKARRTDKKDQLLEVGPSEATDKEREQMQEDNKPSTKDASTTDSSIITVKPMKKKTKKKAVIIE
ncbi:Apl5 protein [Candida orthopsilosis Co 90-125]|uniref:AP-3 complex subunit delta n=1 Tax=Candida orthopsilosis (strain 90-125) TaxID=1136231 RepID=H8X193_CANO9|nr:Apl5 protein [Candida orthopsilosis Co 90-125]CCG22133.1 Apl5 protein [Candida orthopsilosis Co 90-125]